jgi:hypothetical protein
MNWNDQVSSPFNVATGPPSGSQLFHHGPVIRTADGVEPQIDAVMIKRVLNVLSKVFLQTPLTNW